MSRSTEIVAHPPAEVEEALRRLGRNLRTARLRRNLSQQELGERLGVSRFLVMRMERGAPGTAVAAHAGALWALGLTGDLNRVADPDRDAEGRALERSRARRRARRARTGDLSADF